MQRGVTFWEVLAVAGIVLFVVAVLFPIFAKTHRICGHEEARNIPCLSREKQLGLALMMYADDNNALVPPVTSDVKNTWRSAVTPTTMNTKSLYNCPDDTCRASPDGYYSSYALNVGSVLDTPGVKPRTLRSAPQPEALVLLCEVQNTTDADFNIDDPVRFPPDKHILATRHSNGSCYLLADGHAKWFRPSAFIYVPPTTGKMVQAVVRWDRDLLHPLSTNEIAILADAQAHAQ